MAERYLRKGRSVYLEGQLQTRKWTDQSGQERYTTEVVLRHFRGELALLGGRGEGDDAPPVGDDRPARPARRDPGRDPGREPPRDQGRDQPRDRPARDELDDLDDDIPF